MSEDMPEEQQTSLPPGVAGEMADPKEAEFNKMQIRAAAEGPAAEARRQEMQRWSEATGAYAEEAARGHNNTEKYIVERGGTQEAVNKEITDAAYRVAGGVDPRANRHDNAHGEEEPVRVTAYDNGMETRPRYTGHDQSRFDRSPAHINGPAKPLAPETPAAPSAEQQLPQQQGANQGAPVA